MLPSILHLMHIQTPVENVYAALTQGDAISSWYTRTENGDAVPGEILTMHFGEMQFDFYVKEHVKDTRVVWECVRAAIPMVGHVMTFRLDESDGKTRVRFSHEGFEEADDAYANANFSSAKYLESLRQYCQTGRGEAFGSAHYRI